jgi:hypothetical protein
LSLLCFGEQLACDQLMNAWMCAWCRRFVVTVNLELYRLHCPQRPYTVEMELTWRKSHRFKREVPVLPPGLTTNWINGDEKRIEYYSMTPLLVDPYERGLVLTLGPCPCCTARHEKHALIPVIAYEE